MTVLEADDGTTGLELARNEVSDVVLLDVMMLGLDGWQVAAALLEDERTNRIPIVFPTARARDPRPRRSTTSRSRSTRSSSRHACARSYRGSAWAPRRASGRKARGAALAHGVRVARHLHLAPFGA